MARGMLMTTFLGLFLLPLLLGAFLHDRSLVLLINLLVFLAIQLSARNRGKLIASYLYTVGQKCLSIYRSYKIYVVYYGLRLYRALFYLFEMKCLLTWLCTTSALSLSDWIQLEDIRSSLFLVKLDVVLNRASRIKGQKQSKMSKFCCGICVFFILTPIILAPTSMFSCVDPTHIPSKFSLLGRYITFIIALGYLIRFMWTDIRMTIPYEDLSSYHRLIAMCEDIYAARTKGEWNLENVLFSTLVKTYISSLMVLEPKK